MNGTQDQMNGNNDTTSYNNLSMDSRSLLHLLLKSLTSDGRLTPLTELTMKVCVCVCVCTMLSVHYVECALC